MTLYILNNISQLITLKSAHKKDGRNLHPSDVDEISNASVVFNKDEILWVGAADKLPTKYLNDSTNIDCSNHTVLPELVDSHTHLIFGGDRSLEYVMRLNGADYQEIATAGGGILNTVKGTNRLSSDELFDLCVSRISQISAYGIGTIEIKSGYGLNLEKERELSIIIDRLKQHFAPRIQIFNTYMAAHAVPKKFSSSAEYLDQIVIPLLHQLAPLNIIDSVDIFHEQGYFSDDDVIKLFTCAQSLNLPVKSHADEFIDNQGAKLASKYSALSTDHLLCTGKDGIDALSKSSTVATLLPGTGFFLGKPQANGRALLDAGCKVALASDYNPGSCHLDNLLLAASLSAPQYQMNIAELVCAITHNASHALGLKNQGAIIEGMKPRFSIYAVSSIDQIFYNWGKNYSANQLLEEFFL